MPNYIKIADTVAERFNGFQNGGRPPPWIYRGRIWNTHDEHLVAFNVVQNLVGIDAVFFITGRYFEPYA